MAQIKQKLSKLYDLLEISKKSIRNQAFQDTETSMKAVEDVKYFPSVEELDQELVRIRRSLDDALNSRQFGLCNGLKKQIADLEEKRRETQASLPLCTFSSEDLEEKLKYLEVDIAKAFNEKECKYQ